MTARIDYFAIEEAIADQIRNDAGVADLSPKVVVEEIVQIGERPQITIVLESREAPDEVQSINAGTRTRVWMHVSIWCFCFHVTLKKAIEARDNLIQLVEVAVSKDRTFGRIDVNTSWITGGEFDTAKEGKGFNSGAEIELIVDVTAVS